METLIKFMEPTSVFQVVMTVGIAILFYMMATGKISSVGKDGIHFAKLETSMTTILTELKEEVQKSKLDRIEMHQSISDIKSQLDRVIANDERQTAEQRRQSKELLKTQILLEETTYDQKMMLFEEYKKLGGNGWMDVYMEKIKEKLKEQMKVV